MLATMSHSITMTVVIVIKAIVNDDYGTSLLKSNLGLINQIWRTIEEEENSCKWPGKEYLKEFIRIYDVSKFSMVAPVTLG